ncbi:hypothetical protein CHLRE_08g385700v5 [Chlamydomonas reinhardtii]|uniref:Gamma-soluble NSF attachment protein n=1 Tax=Chlamydomonas reinhardtii TaxID=3055 RepID=A0A2K3DIC8_CHLRE|nr:uncharacterized protein CHLRE_08g385700v5 [Chlamydomonas reinhardtii]PNW80293.1 hypothetical protein CHLRE_08g385700v5 [Chlamydomonas reinhardtii]
MSNTIGRSEKSVALEKEAKELLKKAKGLTVPSILELRIKPDWEAAAPLLDKAALMYKQAGNLEKAVEAYERAAYAQERLGSQWHAGKHYEVIAELCRKLEQPARVGHYYKLAADAYMQCGKPTTAGECLCRGARVLEDTDPDTAIKLYYDSLDVYESSEKDAYSVDAFRHAVAFLLRQELWADAVEVQMRFGAVSEKNNARHSQNKAYLGAVVTWLWAGDAEKAWLTFQDAMGVEAFAHTEEAFAADALFEAYRNNDADAVQALVKSKSQFKHMDHCVAKLALRLPNPGCRMRRMARKLNTLMAQSEEEDQGEQGEEGEEGGRHEEELL